MDLGVPLFMEHGTPPFVIHGRVPQAYRQLSLKYHPDKNPDDPLAASRFMQITKARSEGIGTWHILGGSHGLPMV